MLPTFSTVRFGLKNDVSTSTSAYVHIIYKTTRLIHQTAAVSIHYKDNLHQNRFSTFIP